MFTVCLIVALAIFVAFAVWALVLTKIPYKSGRVLKPFYLLFAGVLLSALAMFLPIYGQIFAEGTIKPLEVITMSLHNTFRLFIMDGEFSIVTDNMVGLGGLVADVYAGFFSVLYVLAPILTFGVVLSFFKSVDALKRYAFSFFRDTYIFSELNAKSLALAKSLKKNNRRRVIVFCDVFEQNEEESFELIEKAKEINAILFKKDISAINFGFHSQRRLLAFLAIGDGDSENIKQAMELVERYGGRKNTELYVFSRTVGSELMLSKAGTKNIKVRRINDARSLVLDLLYTGGEQIFSSALTEYEDVKYFHNYKTGKEEPKKCISAVVVGMGLYGREMMKGLTWFCQMEGYTFRLHGFERDANAGARFTSECPELMEEKYNKKMDDVNDAQYDITIHDGVEILSDAFFNKLKEIKDISYVFISLGDDDTNIRIAVAIRAALRRMALEAGKEDTAVIETVVYDENKNKSLNGVFDFSGKSKYDINFVGSLPDYYSEGVLLNSELEKKALERHMMWGGGEEAIRKFWMYEYNYRSSMASVMHRKHKLLIPLMKEIIDIPKEKRTEEQAYVLRTVEHRRWNAYMRTEGWSYGPVRNNLAKLHHCLRPFKELPPEEQIKDDD